MFRKSLPEEQVDKQIALSKMHARVSRVMIVNSNNTDICTCCNQIIYNSQFSITCNVEQFLHLGILFPMYFKTLLYLGYFMVIACVFSLINIILNLLGSSCVNYTNFVCTSSITNIIQYQQKHEGILHFQTVSNYIFIGLSLIFFQFMGSKLKDIKNNMAVNDINESDYGVVYKGVKEKTKEKVYQQIKVLEKKYRERTGRQNLIVKFIMIFNTRQIAEKQLNRITIERQNAEKQIEGSQILQNTNNENVRTLIISESIQEINNEYQIQYQFSGKVIVLFQYPVSHRDFNHVEIQQLTDATDIIWQNIGLKSEVNKNFIMFVGVLFLMIVTFGIIVIMKQWIKHVSQGKHLVVTTILNLFVATIIAIFNSIEGIVIRYCARRQLFGTHSKFFRMVGYRLSYVFFMNMVMSTFFANLFIFLEKKQQQRRWLPINYSGLVNDFFFLFLTNSYISSIFNYFDLFWGAKLYKRYQAQVLKKIYKYSKDELNFIFQGHPVDMGLRYGNILKTLFFTAAISPFVPTGPFLSLLGLIICYWVDKYLLLRRYVCRNHLNWNFAKQMIEFSKYYVVLFAFSNILIQMIPIDKGQDQIQLPDFQKHSNFYISIVMFLFTLFYKFLFKSLKKIIFGKTMQGKKNKLTYNQAKPLFKNKYEDKLNVTDVFQLNEQDIKHKLQQKAGLDPKLIRSIRLNLIQNIYDDSF